MIPQPLPVLPLAVIIILVIGATGFAAYRAGSGAFRHEPGTRGRRTGLAVAAAALTLSLLSVILMVNIMMSHEGIYEALVWTSLSENYGIAPAADSQGFQPGVPFAAIMDGINVSCTAFAPDTVQCDGETVAVLAGVR